MPITNTIPTTYDARPVIDRMSRARLGDTPFDEYRFYQAIITSKRRGDSNYYIDSETNTFDFPNGLKVEVHSSVHWRTGLHCVYIKYNLFYNEGVEWECDGFWPNRIRNEDIDIGWLDDENVIKLLEFVSMIKPIKGSSSDSAGPDLSKFDKHRSSIDPSPHKTHYDRWQNIPISTDVYDFPNGLSVDVTTKGVEKASSTVWVKISDSSKWDCDGFKPNYYRMDFEDGKEIGRMTPENVARFLDVVSKIQPPA